MFSKTILPRGYRWPEDMERCSVWLIIRDMQIKTMKYYLILVRTASMNKSTNKCWWWCGLKATLVHSWWECRLVQPLWKIVWSFLKKLKMELPYDPVIPFLGVYPKDPKANFKEYMHPYVHCSIIYNTQDIEVSGGL